MRKTLRIAIKRIVLVGLGAALAAGLMYIMLGIANAAPDTGANPYPYPKSTYWAWQNRPDLPANLGEAKDWAVNAEAQGWPVSNYPRKGDIAVLQPGVYGADRTRGHVAVVEQVFEDGTYMTSQMDESDCKYESSSCGRINKRSYPLAAGARFIHYKVDTRTTWSFASGAAGWTAYNLGGGQTGGPGWYYPLTGGQPQLVSPALDIPLDSYSALQIELATGLPVSDPTIRIYFATADQPEFSADNSFTIKGQADGQVHIYTADFSANPAWRGHLTRLRLDPAGPGATGGVRIDRASLIASGNSQADGFTALTQQTRGGAAPGARSQ